MMVQRRVREGGGDARRGEVTEGNACRKPKPTGRRKIDERNGQTGDKLGKQQEQTKSHGDEENRLRARVWGDLQLQKASNCAGSRLWVRSEDKECLRPG